MSKPKIVLNHRGFAEVRNSAAVVNRLAAEARAIAGRSGPGYETRGPETGSARGRAAVITGTAEARRAEALNHNLARG